ncbi:MAG: hypothetical protein ACTSX9_03300 [Candidatus Njordarchaeales archaeon]
MFDKILTEFKYFFGQEPIKEENKIIVSLGPPTKRFNLTFRFEENCIIVDNILPEITEDLFHLLKEYLPSNSHNAELFLQDRSLCLKISRYKEDDAVLKDCLNIIKRIYEVATEKLPHLTWRTLGEMRLKILNEEVSILSPDFLEPIRTGWRAELVVVLPRDDKWFRSTLGLDNLDLPLLSYIDQSEVYAFEPHENGSLVPVNLSEIIEEIKQLLDSTGLWRIERVNDVIEMVSNPEIIARILSTLKMLKNDLPFPPSLIGTSQRVSRETLDRIITVLENAYEKLSKIRNVDRFFYLKIVTRLAVLFARNIIQRGGAGGVLVSNVRKVSKLGAGKAVYIGKEELKYLELGDRVLVSVIEEDGKRKIIIEPI